VPRKSSRGPRGIDVDLDGSREEQVQAHARPGAPEGLPLDSEEELRASVFSREGARDLRRPGHITEDHRHARDGRAAAIHDAHADGWIGLEHEDDGSWLARVDLGLREATPGSCGHERRTGGRRDAGAAVPVGHAAPAEALEAGVVEIGIAGDRRARRRPVDHEDLRLRGRRPGRAVEDEDLERFAEDVRGRVARGRGTSALLRFHLRDDRRGLSLRRRGLAPRPHGSRRPGTGTRDLTSRATPSRISAPPAIPHCRPLIVDPVTRPALRGNCRARTPARGEAGVHPSGGSPSFGYRRDALPSSLET